MIWSEKKQGLRPLDKERRAEQVVGSNTGRASGQKKKQNKKEDTNNSQPQQKQTGGLLQQGSVVPLSKEATDLKIKPGESMRDFSRRVNEALPVGRGKSEGPSRGALRAQKKRAKVEKEMEAARQRKIERGEIDDDGEEDEDVRWSQHGPTNANGNSKKRGKRDVSPDPWAHLQKPAPKFGDVVDRPPELNLSAKILNNVPKSAGSMAKRFMLQEERQKVIDGYRALMEQKRGEVDM